MMQRKSQNRRPRQRINTGPCFFCISKTIPDYKEVEVLKKFMTERGKIMPRTKTGFCQMHQHRLTTEIKRARYLAMLPFVGGVR